VTNAEKEKLSLGAIVRTFLICRLGLNGCFARVALLIGTLEWLVYLFYPTPGGDSGGFFCVVGAAWEVLLDVRAWVAIDAWRYFLPDSVRVDAAIGCLADLL
jgi:hypothetical protein